MDTINSHRFSIEGFRTLPEVKPPLEFFGGRVIQKMSPRLPHSIVQTELSFALLSHTKLTRQGRAYTELRCTFGGSSHVFDLSFFVQSRLPDGRNLADRLEVGSPPDLAVEILSLGQTVGELSRKLRSAIRRGVRLGWLIDESHRTIHVFHPTRKPLVLKPGDMLSGEDLLPGFALAVDEIFRWVDMNCMDSISIEFSSSGAAGEHDPPSSPEATQQPGGGDRLGMDGVDRDDLLDLETARPEVVGKFRPAEQVNLHPGHPSVGHLPIAETNLAKQALAKLAQQPAPSLWVSKVEPDVVGMERQATARSKNPECLP